MRQLLLCLSVLLLGLSWAAAQDTSSQSSPNSTSTGQASSSGQTSSTAAGGETTVEGCLSGSNGNFTLSDKNGTTYSLTGDTAKLSEHVGHEVKITGSSSSASFFAKQHRNSECDGKCRCTAEPASQLRKACLQDLPIWWRNREVRSVQPDSNNFVSGARPHAGLFCSLRSRQIDACSAAQWQTRGRSYAGRRTPTCMQPARLRRAPVGARYRMGLRMGRASNKLRMGRSSFAEDWG